MVRVLFWWNLPAGRGAALDAIADQVDCDVVELVRETTIEGCLRELPTADLLVLGDVPPEVAHHVAPAINSAPRLQGMHFISAGRDGFDGIEFAEHLVITGQRGATAPNVAEHGMAMLLGLIRCMPAIVRNKDAGVWDKSFVTGLGSIEGRRVLIVGLGHIGRAYGQRLRAFGAKTVGLQRTPRQDGSVDEVAPLHELDDRLADADVVVLTIAQTPETRGLMGAERIARMRPNAILVNSARGALVDTDALAEALHAGSLGGAAVDVTDPEPLPAGHPLWTAPNTIISPHIGGGGNPLAAMRLATGICDRVRELAEL